MNALHLYRQTVKKLEKVSDCADFEAKCLLENYFSLSLSDIYSQKEIKTDFSALDSAIDKRLDNFPLQYIIGKWEFMDSEFELNENVLIPRPETEILCECLAPEITPKSVVYDLCSGSGCVAISVQKLTGAKVYAFEKYDGAFEILERNIKLNSSSVTAVKSDICKKPNFNIPKANFILSNPPYIKSEEISSLQKEVLNEPLTALDGGEDGYFFYRAINKNYLPLLNDNGFLAVEIGEGQQEEVIKIFSSLTHIKTIKDYNGIDRTVVFRKGK